MYEFLAMMGWYNSGGCGCTPKKYTWKHNDFPDYKYKVTPSRGTWQLFEHDVRIRVGQHMSIESQFAQQFEQQQP